MKRVNVSVNLGLIFVIINNVGIKINAEMNANKLTDEGICDKWFIWNPSNCEFECDKSYDVGEYLDYENCKCRKKLVDKLVDEYAETIEEVKIAKKALAQNENKHKRSCCTLYIVFMIVVLSISARIDTYFVYYNWSLVKNVLRIIFNTRTQTAI